VSGPIVRRYGFPNFEKIFGERPLEHGVDDVEKCQDAAKPEDAPSTRQPGGTIPTTPIPKQPADGQ